MRAVYITSVQPKGAADFIISTIIVGFSRITLYVITKNYFGFTLKGLLRYSLKVLYINTQRVFIITKSKYIIRMGTKERLKRRIFYNKFVIKSYKNAVLFPYLLRVI